MNLKGDAERAAAADAVGHTFWRIPTSSYRFLAASADDIDHPGLLVLAAQHGTQAVHVVQGPPRA